MARDKKKEFKKVYFTTNRQKVYATMYVDAKGFFTIKVPWKMSEALALDEDELSGKDAEKVEHAYLKLMREYDRLTVASVYRIKYRIMLSDRIRSQMPLAIMTDEAWKQSARIGSEYVPQKALSMLVDWFPVEIRLKGKNEVISRLKVPGEDDWYIQNADKAIKAGKDAELYLQGIHKPYEGLVLVHDQQHWEDDDSHVYRDIPLTAETFEFFSSIEGSFVSMMTKLFGFLNRDEKLLMQDISKALEGKSSFLSIENKTNE